MRKRPLLLRIVLVAACVDSAGCGPGQAPRGAIQAAPTSITFGNAHAEIEVTSDEGGLRTYRLTTTAKRRDDLPANPRTISERDGAPRLRTGNAMFDALHALALEEVREASVANIRTDDFDDGQPIACAPGGCFETGRQWTYVWTRDTSYSADLGLAMIDPTRTRNSLELKLSERRGGGRSEIVQDTGSGGSWPVSTDRVAWALGAGKLLLALQGEERTRFRDRAFEALRNTIERDRLVVFDADDGLYRGEQSFLDWRAQTYPPWTATDTLQVGLSKALSTNVDHYRAITLASELADEKGDAELAAKYRGWASALRDSIRARLWREDRGMFSTFAPSVLDPAPVARFDALGEALAVISGIADDRQAARIVAAYPMAPFGPPVVWPEERDVAVYHNRAVWPFVTAYWLLAARKARNDAVADLCVESLVRGAALELSNVENFEMVTGDTAAPVVDSQRQLWSVAGYLAMVDDVIFGRQVSREGIRFRPYVTRGMHRALFAGSDRLVLDRVPWHGRTFTVIVQLPSLAAGKTGGAYRVASVRANGREIGDAYVPNALDATDGRDVRIEITLAADGDPPAKAKIADPSSFYAPGIPAITAVTATDRALHVALEPSPASSGSTMLEVFRDGVPAGVDLPGDAREWVDARATGDGSHCYAVEAIDRRSHVASHRSRPVCWWGDHGQLSSTIKPDAELRVAASGQYLVQLVGENPGDVTTGVTCAVVRVTIEAANARGYVFMPHGGAESSYVRVQLEAGKSYRVVVDRDANAVNMSAFAHFAHYTRGRGGRSGEEDSLTVDAIRVLARPSPAP